MAGYSPTCQKPHTPLQSCQKPHPPDHVNDGIAWRAPSPRPDRGQPRRPPWECVYGLVYHHNAAMTTSSWDCPQPVGSWPCPLQGPQALAPPPACFMAVRPARGATRQMALSTDLLSHVRPGSTPKRHARKKNIPQEIKTNPE